MIKKAILLMPLLFNSIITNSTELPGEYEIAALFPTTNGVAIQLNPNPPQCTSSWWGTQAVINKDIANYQTLLAMMTTAFVSNKKISAIHYQSAGNGSCSNGNELHIIAYKINK